MVKKVLIADDEARMRKLIGDFLRREGYDITEAEDGREALDTFEREQEINLVILDVMMPKCDGWIVCKEIRKISRVPIIMLTARTEESDELFGFDLGADEYIAKPFSPKILVARIKALLRRIDGKDMETISFDGLDIDTKGHNVWVNDKPLDLSPKEYELLLYMSKNNGRVLNRNQILNAVWDCNYFGDTRTVDTHIKKLRMKMESKGYYIQTVRGFGYKFEANHPKFNKI